MASMAPTPSVSRARLPHINLLIPAPIPPLALMKERKHTRNEEEDRVHDPKRKTRLLHRALFVGSEMQSLNCN